MTTADVFRQAEELKIAAQDTSRGANEAWMSRQALQDVYQRLLVMDLEYALDKKIEQELWNHAFKNQISTLQNQVKDKQNQKRGEIQASLNLFLETASGFYLQLLQELCSTFNLDLPFRKKASYFGIIKEYGPVNLKIKSPKKTSCMYICQHCLVHLGDIARYRQQIDQAQAYYRHAARLVPFNGQPYNQLAILEAAKGNKLSTVFYYVRSIAVKHPFPVAATNLEKLFVKISKDSHEPRQKLSATDIIATFLQLHTFVYLCVNLAKAKSHIEKIICSLPSNIGSQSFSSYQLVQMVALNLYSLQRSKRRLGGNQANCETGDENGRNRSSESSVDLCNESNEPVANGNQQGAYDMMFSFTVSLLNVLLQSARKLEVKARESAVLPALKILLDWIRSEPESLSNPTFGEPVIWVNLCKVLNSMQVESESTEPQSFADSKMPLDEDRDLECFLPINKSLSDLDFNLMPNTDSLSEEIETRLRCRRLVATGCWISEAFPSLNLLNAKRLPSGRIYFTTQLQDLNENAVNDENSFEQKVDQQNVACQVIPFKGKDNRGLPTDKKSTTDRAQKVQIKLAKKETEVSSAGPEKFDAGNMTSIQNNLGNDNVVSAAQKNQQMLRITDMDSSAGTTSFNVSPMSVQSPSFRQTAFNSSTSCEPPSFVPPLTAAHLPNNIFAGSFSQQRVAPGLNGPDVSVSIAQTEPNHNGNERIVTGSFEPFSHLFSMPPPAPTGSVLGTTYFPVGQHVGFPWSRLPPPMFMQAPDGFSQASAPIAISSQPWSSSATPVATNHYASMSTYTNVSALSDTSSSLMFKPGDEIPCASPDHEPREMPNPIKSPIPKCEVRYHHRRSPPSHLMSDVPESYLATPMLSQGASSPYCGSPTVDGIYLSRSLPNNMRSGGLQCGPNGSFKGPAAFPTDAGMMARSPFSNFFQPENSFFGSDETVGRNTGYGNSPSAAGSSFSPINSGSSLFTTSMDEKIEAHLPAANTYSLFSQSPWPLGITNSQAQSGDASSHRSSPFESSNSGSLRVTPDPFAPEDRPPPCVAVSGVRPLGPLSGSGSWKSSESSVASLKSSTLPEGDGGFVANLNMQSLWTSGPSPLQKLLDQQKQQRQTTTPR